MATNRSILLEAIGFDVQGSLLDRALLKWQVDGSAEYSADAETALLNAELDVLLRVQHLASIKAGSESLTFSASGLRERIRLLAKQLGRKESEAGDKATIRSATHLW